MTSSERVAPIESLDDAKARIASALSWIERYRSKMDGLTLILDHIRDSLLGLSDTDATPGAQTSPMPAERAEFYLAGGR